MVKPGKHPDAAGASIAAIEAGGTKFNCAIFSAAGQLLASTRIPTTSPDDTLAKSLSFFHDHAEKHGSLVAAGIASFGPLDLDPKSPNCGSIFSTPKPGWSGVNIQQAFREGLGVTTLIDTDVNCAALAEGRFGAARECNTFCYITVGTGIGVGIISDKKPIGGSGHPELGHTRVPRAPNDKFDGRCPYHRDCVEGLACGPAIMDRWGERAENLADDHTAWEMEAYYIASLCMNIIYTVRPEKIVIGGGVFERKTLYVRVREHLAKLLADYALTPVERDLKRFICEPGLTETAPGLLGALELARVVADLQCGGHDAR